MLNGIKKLINEKKAFQEAAELILEDERLDDSIMLSEGPDDPELDKKDDTEPVTPEPEEGSEPETPVEDEPVEDGVEEPTTPPEDDDVSNAPVDGGEEPMPLPGDDDLPTPVGRQTGEPVTDTGDILSTEIDLASNTMQDILPVPPANAAEALGGDDDDDILNQRIDSGFGDEPIEPAPSDTADDIMDAPIDDPTPLATPVEGDGEGEEGSEPAEESGDILSEAITLDGNDAGAAPADDGTAAPGDAGGAAATEDPTAGTDPAPTDDGTAAPTEENPVTAAVKDKVAEMDAAETGPNENSSKEALLKKLGNLTKGLEDAKKAVMDSIQ